MLPQSRKINFIAAACAAMTVLGTLAPACGPFFPNQVIINGDNGVLTMPIGDFVAEMAKLRPSAPSPILAVQSKDSDFNFSATTDEQELRQALKANAIAQTRIDQIAGQYAASRAMIAQFAAAVSGDREKALPVPTVRKLGDVPIPDGLPPEFRDYLTGLIAFHQGNLAVARMAWENVLALPPEQRHLRSVWATFMLGKSFLTGDISQARNWFSETRELAAAGFSDSLGLASSSLGWEARAELNAGNISRAVPLYLQQYSTGDDLAAISLRDSARAAFAAPPQILSATAQDPLSRAVITAYILSDGGPFRHFGAQDQARAEQWLTAVESAAVKDMPGADRLAWAAYRLGDFDAASRWAARAPSDSPVARWVRSKLFLRDGKINDAAATLSAAVKSFPPDDQRLSAEGIFGDDPDQQTFRIYPAAAGDLAVLQLKRGQYTDSLDLLLRADFWMDAAYIAERVLSADELKTYVDRHFPAAIGKFDPDAMDATRTNSQKNRDAQGNQIRYLLARRLTRLGRWKEARPYFPADLQKPLDDYIAAIRTGNDAHLSIDKRAQGFATAAHIARKQGMELLGTELEPDFYCYLGSYVDPDHADGKIRGSGQTLTAPSSDELKRLAANAPADTRRFHYRFIAADHAWSASELMPDNTDATAELLCEAGGWLKDQNPKSADRFYKALVQRCPSTELGKEAIAAHWFPKPKESASAGDTR